jgi:serine carboxypeptidase-like clade 4
VTGESYAGHYVPAVTGRLHRALKKKEGVPINLKGFAIGNGMTQPDIQYEAYADYALDMGLISESDYTKLSKLYPACVKAAKICGQLFHFYCESSN